MKLRDLALFGLTMIRPAWPTEEQAASRAVPKVDLTSDDVVQKVVDFASNMLLDVLALAVVSHQFNAAVQRVVATDTSVSQLPHARWLLTDRMAQHFCNWSRISVVGFGDQLPLASVGVEIPEGDAVVYHCCRCRCPTLRCRDIVSTNYHGAWGPAFLVDRLYNAAVERASYAAAFVTGSYIVRDVVCSCCRLMLGKKYVEARDPANRFKVGKILLEQTMVFLPACCSGSTNVQRGKPRRPQDDGNRICVRCAAHLQCRTVQAVILLTGGFRPGASRRLREALIDEQDLIHKFRPASSESMSLPASGGVQGASGHVVLKRAKVPSRRAPDDCRDGFNRGTGGNVERCVDQGLTRSLSCRLGALCGALPGGVDPKLLASFVDQVTNTIITHASGRHQPRDVSSISSAGGHSFRSYATAGGTPNPATGTQFAPAPRLSRRQGHPRHGPAYAEPEQVGMGPSGGGNDALHASDLRSDVLDTAARIARWELIAPSAVSVCRDFHAARGFVVSLNTAWQPSFPAEKPGAERLIEHMAVRLGLDQEDRGLLLQELGLKKPSSCCLWFPCRVSL